MLSSDQCQIKNVVVEAHFCDSDHIVESFDLNLEQRQVILIEKKNNMT